MYLCTPPFWGKCHWSAICVYVFVYFRVCVFVCGTDSLCFYMPELLLLALFRRAVSGAVLEIHQPWQVHCSATLHSLRPTTHTKISLSIRKTFVSGWRWIWKGCGDLKEEKKIEEGARQRFSAWKDAACLEEKQIYIKPASHFCITFSLKIKFTFLVNRDSHSCQVWRWMLKIICVIGSAT